MAARRDRRRVVVEQVDVRAVARDPRGDAAQALAGRRRARSRAAPRRRSRPPRPRGGSRGSCAGGSRATRLRFSSWILRWAPVRRAERQRRRRVRQRPRGRRRPRGGSRARAARRSARRGPGRPTSPPRPRAAGARASRGTRRGCRSPTATGSRPATGSRRRRRRPAHGIRSAIPSSVWPSVGQQLELGVADPDVAGDRQRLDLPERQRPRALDVVLLVELAQLALRPRPARARRRAAVVSAQPSAASGNAKRPSRWSQSPCVHSSPTAPSPPARTTTGSASSSCGSTGESMTKHSASPSSPARWTIVQRRLPERAADDDDVSVEADGLHAPATPRRAAWPPRGAS